MKNLREAGSLLGLATLFGATAEAQIITPLIVEGDQVSIGTVTEILNVDVNNYGDWLVELKTDASPYWTDNAIVLNGTVIHEEGTNFGLPAPQSNLWVYDSYVDSMDVNDEGDVLVHMHVADPNGSLTPKELVLWTSGETGVTYVLLEELVTPALLDGEPVGAVWHSFHEVYQNNSGQLLVTGETDTGYEDVQAVMTHDGAGNITSQTLFAREGVVHSTAFPPADGTHAEPVQGLGYRKETVAFNDHGQKMYFIDDETYGAGGSPDYTAVDSHYYIDDTEIMWEADVAPTNGSWQYDHLSFSEVDLNNNGEWVAVVGDTNPDSTQDYCIIRNGELFVQEGQPVPGLSGNYIMTGYYWGRVRISDSGDVTWFCEWNNPNGDENSGLWRNDELLIQEGVTSIGGLLVDTIESGADYMATSASGRFIIQTLNMEGYLHGAYLIDIPIAEAYCFGDGSALHCPCANPGGEGRGCANSVSQGAMLTAEGSASIERDDLLLVGEGLPPGAMGVFFMGNAQINGGQGVLFGDGQLCVASAIRRVQTVAADANGDIASTVPIASGFGASLNTTNYFQLWYQDPSPPCGSMFNMSNALAVEWN